MIIDKTATDPARHHRCTTTFATARAAFQAYLSDVEFGAGEVVLMPAYIGWSPREGSGVFDPITTLSLDVRFYAMTDRLHIDIDAYRAALARGKVRVVVLIHYFGYVDPSYRAAVELARAAGALILEDSAHAMLTDLIGGGCGRLGDASIYSLHKLLPTPSGGILVRNGMSDGQEKESGAPFRLWDHDLLRIGERRRRNGRALTELLAPLAPRIEPLWPHLQPTEIPQTYPVLVHGVSRFALYTAMNEAGYGVVSLYHTMIQQLGRAEHPVSHWLADHILNLPVHQDVEPDQLAPMVETLGRLAASLAEAEPINEARSGPASPAPFRAD